MNEDNQTTESAHTNNLETPSTVPKGQGNHAIEVVLQWVTYGLWEWALIALSVLLSVTFSYYFDRTGYAANANPNFVIYSLAAMLCLLPMAFAANRYYARREASKKTGFAAVVMVINAVGVFLATIGALITAVINVLSDMLNGGSADTNIAIASSLVIALLGVMLFVRIINLDRSRRFVKLFPLIAVLIAGVATVMALTGPFRSGVQTRTDRLIENNLPTLDEDIQDYASDNNNLPAKLQDIDFVSEDDTGTSSGQALVQRHLVSYTITNADPSQLNYRLCVTYDKVLGTAGNDNSDDSSIDTSSHTAGRVCYEQSAGTGTGTVCPDSSSDTADDLVCE